MAGVKSRRKEGWENFGKLIIWSLKLFLRSAQFEYSLSCLKKGLNKLFLSNMFEFICDPLHGLARQLRYECHRKHA